MRDRKRIGGRQRSLAFLSFFSYREIPLPAGKFKLHTNQETKRLTKQRKGVRPFGSQILLRCRCLLLRQSFLISGSDMCRLNSLPSVPCRVKRIHQMNSSNMKTKKLFGNLSEKLQLMYRPLLSWLKNSTTIVNCFNAIA